MIKGLTCLLGMAVIAAPPSSADIAVFENGRILKITGIYAEDDYLTLILPGGGELSVERDYIYRILKDEIEPPKKGKRKRSLKTTEFDGLIRSLCSEHGVDEKLVKALISVESSFNPAAVSIDGAVGLMQVLPSTAGDYGITDLHDPSNNLKAGITHLSRLLSLFGADELEKVLAAYNAGANAVKRYGGVPPYSETRGYVKKIMSIYRPDGEDTSGFPG